MPTCAAFGCDNRQGQCEDKSVSFHRFPLDKTTCDEWLKRIERAQSLGKSRSKISLVHCSVESNSNVTKPWKPTGTSVMCSKHFKDDDFEEDAYVKYGLKSPSKSKRKLFTWAIPSIFSPRPKHSESERSTPQRQTRKVNRKAKQMVSYSL